MRYLYHMHRLYNVELQIELWRQKVWNVIIFMENEWFHAWFFARKKIIEVNCKENERNQSVLRKWLRRRSFWNAVKNRTFVSDAMRDGARMTRLNWAIKINHNIASWNAFLVSFLSSIKNKKDWKFGYLVLWFTSFAESLLWYNLFRPKKVRILLLGGKNYLWFLHICQQKIESEAISDFIIYL